jgi:hypothetical protein
MIVEIDDKWLMCMLDVPNIIAHMCLGLLIARKASDFAMSIN